MSRSPKGEIDNRPRRFYREVAVVGRDDHWTIQLDGKPLRTPDKKLLVLPTEPLARVIADEWSSQVDRIDLQNMFNTRLANVAIDRTPGTRAAIGAETARYAHTDLVCHLAESPAALRGRQEKAWKPHLEWVGREFGVELKTVEGVVPVEQPAESVERVRLHAVGLDDFRLSGFAHAVALLGSAVLGLAVERGRITVGEAFELSCIDEVFQAEHWGEDAEAARRTARNRAEARALDLWFGALGEA
jgi:chaperone required for assembly of F1-ATPase